jgi:endonuclease/exonuclease/phosphatase family metal-dependent hydrolase
VDLPSDPRLERGPLLDRARRWAESRGDVPLVTLGDFNTPFDASGFDAWRAAFRHAFATSGSGWAPTWPMPIPVLEIDHVWTNSRIDVSRCEHGLSLASDHRPVLFEFDVVTR